MMHADPLVISESSLSVAWGRVFLHTLDNARPTLRPIVVTVDGLANQAPPEDADVRQAVDAALAAQSNMNSVRVSALMIFPYDMWVRRGRPSCQEFSRFCVDRLVPRLKALDRRNRYGTYFERMMRFSGIRAGLPHTIDQLDFVIRLLMRPRRSRHSALQITCFDPAKDHTGQAVRGFPCLQQVSVAQDDSGKLAINAYYPTQYIFDRAYGNYLGLCHLGQFLAHETGLTFERLTCFIGQPVLGDVRKRDLRSLAPIVRSKLPN
jgi:hypothetical protein